MRGSTSIVFHFSYWYAILKCYYQVLLSKMLRETRLDTFAHKTSEMRQHIELMHRYLTAYETHDVMLHMDVCRSAASSRLEGKGDVPMHV